MNKEIKAWLDSGRDYQSGVQLYARYGNSSTLKRIFERSDQSENSTNTLHYELSRLLDVPEDTVPVRQSAATAIAPASIPRSAARDPEPLVPSAPLTPEEKILFDSIKEKLKLRDKLHATLEYVSEDLRKVNARQIVEISDDITRSYERFEHLKKTGELLPEKAGKGKKPPTNYAVLTDIQLMSTKANIRSKISYYKMLINDPAKEKSLKHNKSRLEFWKQELSTVLNLLS